MHIGQNMGHASPHKMKFQKYQHIHRQNIKGRWEEINVLSGLDLSFGMNGQHCWSQIQDLQQALEQRLQVLSRFVQGEDRGACLQPGM